MTEIGPSGAVPEIVAISRGIKVPAAPHLGPRMIAALQKGRYERREVEAASAAIPRGARILELGAGSGYVGAAIARACAPTAMLAIEANAALLPHIRTLYALNGLDDRIELRHGVVMSDPDAPADAIFHVRGNFLGSGLAERNAAKATSVQVPVHRYAHLKESFPHDTIVMDIEGAEREFLANADLTGVNLLIFETHRDVYGREGMKACRRALAAQGLAIDAEISRGGVHVWRREGVAAPQARKDVLPVDDAGVFSSRTLRLRNALVVPERDTDAKLASGVLTEDGSYAELSRTWIRAFKSTTPPTLGAREQVGVLPGRHLFAGHLRGHFGHFLVESTARLWALGEADIAPESVLFLPYGGKPRAAKQALAAYQPFFDCLGLEVPVQIVRQPLRVEHLILPELGFGWRARFAGSPAFRAFMQDRLKAASKPEGSEYLYISRSKLRADKGGLLGESVIEANLAALGYEIFHPEKHDIRTQIARYRAARRIVALDGSALHLAAFVVAPETRVAIILRRTRANHADYTRQYEAFAGITPDIVNAIRADWASGASLRSDFRSVGEADFPALFAALARSDYIPRDSPLELPDAAARREMLEALAEQRTDGLMPVGSVGGKDGL